jgi:plastocyanin
MKSVFPAAGVVVGALLLAVSCQPNPPPAANHVYADDYQFVPESLSIARGDTVTWANRGAVQHTSTSGTNGFPDGRWDSPAMAPGDSFRRAFDSTGTYPYYCRFHSGSGMRGWIVVE